MILENRNILVKVLGCRSSLCEGEFIAGKLALMGANITDDFNAENLSAAVIVTCSVTSEADKKCRQIIRRARRILGDDGVLAVCGCWAERENFGDFGIDIIAGSRGKIFIPNEIAGMLSTGKREFRDLRKVSRENSWEELAINYPVLHSRAFVKIQDGCDHFCTYCIIPFLRGKPISRPEENILREIERLISNGCREIILTGIHLGLYGRDINSSLANLIAKISRVKNLARLRLGSLEPFSLDENLLRKLSECEIFCPHLHLPLQSGDDKILEAMRRGYNSGEFLRICENARKFLGENLHISSDILVGFPGEDDRAFQNTLQIMKSAKFGRVHVFPYSPRNGTLAAKFPGQIAPETKNSRTNQAIELGKNLFTDYARNFLGSEIEVLVEKSGANYAIGHSRHYIEVSIPQNLERNQLITLRAKTFSDARLEAEFITPNTPDNRNLRREFQAKSCVREPEKFSS